MEDIYLYNLCITGCISNKCSNHHLLLWLANTALSRAEVKEKEGQAGVMRGKRRIVVGLKINWRESCPPGNSHHGQGQGIKGWQTLTVFSGICCGYWDGGHLKEGQSVFSVFSAVFSTGLDAVLDKLRRLGRNGRKQARATTKAITGVGRSWGEKQVK